MKKGIIISLVILLGIFGGFVYYQKSRTIESKGDTEVLSTPTAKEISEEDNVFTEYENKIYTNVKSITRAEFIDLVVTDGNAIHIQLTGDKSKIMSNMEEIKSYIKKNKDSKYVKYEIVIITNGAILDRFDI